MYPVVLNLQKKHCLLVGGGMIAFRKAIPVLEAGGSLTVVARDFVEGFQELATEYGMTLYKRSYESPEAADYELVIAATSDRRVNEAISRDAQAAGRLVNVVDVPDLCSFYVPAVVRRGSLNIAISTEGAFPSLTKVIKADLEKSFSPRYALLLDRLAEFRVRLRERVPDDKERQQKAAAVAGSEAVALFLAGDDSMLEAELLLK
jgi:precorrin-2 dehydrogenase/sirohydrochlorin ferrochelatase